MPCHTLGSLLVWFSLCVQVSALGADGPGPTQAQIVTHAKKSTALIELGEEKSGYATAFCIRSTGLFVTNEHAIRAVGKGGSVKLILEAGTDQQRIVTADVTQFDPALDLAFLQVKPDQAKELTSLELGDATTLTETQSLTSFGFPFGKNLALKMGEYPAMSVNVGRVTSLRRLDGNLHRIQLDAELNPGNSGGPVLDEKGKVVGIVVSGILGTALNFAIPINHLRRLEIMPEVEFTPPSISLFNAYEPATYKIRAIPASDEASKLSAELLLGPDGPHQQRLSSTTADSQTFTITAPPLPGPATIVASILFPNRWLVGTMPTTNFDLDGVPTPLHHYRRLQFQPESLVVTPDGKSQMAKVSGLAQTQLDIGIETVPCDLGQSLAMDAYPQPPMANHVPYRLRVTVDGQPAYERLDVMNLSHMPRPVLLVPKQTRMTFDAATSTIRYETTEDPADGLWEPPGRWLDLFSWVDPAKDGVKGQWQMVNSALRIESTLSGDESPRLVLPVAPRGIYRVQFSYFRSAGDGAVDLYLPIEESAVLLTLSSEKGSMGLGRVKGLESWHPDNPTRHPRRPNNGHLHTVDVLVNPKGDQVTIPAALSGTLIVNWTGPRTDLSLGGHASLPSTRSLGLGVGLGTVEFLQARLQIIQGVAEPTRPDLSFNASADLVPVTEEQLRKDLVLHYRFDDMEPNTQVVKDHSPSGLDGTLQGSPRKTFDPRIGPALVFDGVDDCITVGNPEQLNFEGQITMTAWVAIDAQFPQRNIIAHGYTENPQREVYLRIGGAQIEAGSWMGDTKPNHKAIIPIHQQDARAWLHLAGVYDGTAWRLYRNGRLANVTANEFGAVKVESPWAIGARGGGPERYFSGAMRGVRIYRRALSGDEIQALAESPSTP